MLHIVPFMPTVIFNPIAFFVSLHLVNLFMYAFERHVPHVLSNVMVNMKHELMKECNSVLQICDSLLLNNDLLVSETD
jgi:hypothetical protein